MPFVTRKFGSDWLVLDFQPRFQRHQRHHTHLLLMIAYAWKKKRVAGSVSGMEFAFSEASVGFLLLRLEINLDSWAWCCVKTYSVYIFTRVPSKLRPGARRLCVNVWDV